MLRALINRAAEALNATVAQNVASAGLRVVVETFSLFDPVSNLRHISADASDLAQASI